MKQPTMVFRIAGDTADASKIIEHEGARIEYQILDLEPSECPEGWFPSHAEAVTVRAQEAEKPKRGRKPKGEDEVTENGDDR